MVLFRINKLGNNRHHYCDLENFKGNTNIIIKGFQNHERFQETA